MNNENSKLITTEIERARQFIDDVKRINAEHGMRSVESKDAYDNAVKQAYKQISSIQRTGKNTAT
jgi:hypothetical protein